MRFLFLTQLPFSRYPSYKRAAGMGEALACLGHEVFIAVLDCDENRRRVLFEAPHCNPVWFSKGNAIHEVFAKIRMLRRLQPDYVYIPTYGLRNLLGLRWMLSRKTKFIFELNELNSVFAQHRWFWRAAERIGLRECDIQVCASRMLEAYVKQKCEENRLCRKIIYSPYAYPPYLMRTEHKNARTMMIVFMAALYKEYGIHDVLTATHELIDEGLDLSLLIVGGGPELESSLACVDQWGVENRIKLLGFVPEEEINAVFSNADVFVAPMRDTLQDKYRCPSKMFYYIAYGKPIVTCKIGNPYDILSDKGFYYEPENVSSMKDAIKRALSARSFTYPDGFVSKHSWMARAQQFLSELLH